MRTRYLSLLLAAMVACSSAPGAGRSGAAGGRATHKEIAPIGRSRSLRFQQLQTFCMDPKGRLLVADSAARLIRVLDGEGKLLATWKPGITPQAVHVADDGKAYAGGNGTIARLDKDGRAAKTVGVGASMVYGRRPQVASICSTKKDVFVSIRGKTGYEVHRLTRDLSDARRIITGLRGCCGQMDIKATDGVLYVAENGRHRVSRYDRNGKMLSSWGRRDRKSLEGFGSCCNPMNIFFGADGMLYTSEASVCRVKRYTPEGRFLGLVGKTGASGGCVHMAVAASKDGSRVYVADTSAKIIRVLAGAPQVKLAKRVADRKPR